MPRKASSKYGNRGITGYHARGKRRNADYYGEYINGVQKTPDVIAGTVSIKKREE